MDSFSPRTAAETCSSISRLSNVPALVLSMRVKLSNMRLSVIVVSSLPRTSRSVDRDGSLTTSRPRYRLEFRVACDLAPDVANEPAEAGAQNAQLSTVAVELFGMGITRP